MRRRRGPARKRDDEGRTVHAAQSGHGEATERETGLEDDGFVFWPTNLGEPAGPRLVQVEQRRREPEKAVRPRRRRATTVLLTLLFFAGAALTAAAGNEVATIVSSSPESPAIETTSTDATTTDATTTDTTGTTTAVAEEPSTTTTATTATTTAPVDVDVPPASDTETTPTSTTTETPATDQPSGGGDGGVDPAQTTTAAPAATPSEPPLDNPATSPVTGASDKAPAAGTSSQPESEPTPLLPPQTAAKSTGHKRVKQAKAGYASLHKAPKLSEIEPEGNESGVTGDVHWINQPLPDPTPASLRLSREFAQQLRETSSAEGLHWAFLLAVLRTEQLDGSGQVELSVLQKKAALLGPLHVRSSDREAALAYKPDAVFARRVLVLEHYYKALGLSALVNGLTDSRAKLAAKILADQRIEIYPGGREDISTEKVDVRVLAMIAFLAESFGDVRVSCLISGHRLYARPGVISTHIYGRGLDIGAIERVSILGHQQQSSVTARAVKQILLLPAEVLPRQVISLLGFGGPSFPLADHYNHIHIGY